MATFIKQYDDKGKVRAYKAQIRINGRSYNKTCVRKAAAEKWAIRKLIELQDMGAEGQTGVDITFSKLSKRFDDDYRTRYWVKCLGTTKLLNITAHDIALHLQRYERGSVQRGNGYDDEGQRKIADTGKRRSPATVNAMLSSVSVMLQEAVEDMELAIRSNPATDKSMVKRRKVNNERSRFLNDQERDDLLTACKASTWDKLTLLVMLAITTGARQGELLSLRWDQIDFNTRKALLPTTKNGKPRVLSFPPVSMKLLNQYREVGNGLIFSGITGKPMVFRKHWDKAVEQAGITDFRFHDLRHTAASYLVQNGASLFETQNVLGHSSPAMTKRYAHLRTQDAERVTDDAMSKVFSNE